MGFPAATTCFRSVTSTRLLSCIGRATPWPQSGAKECVNATTVLNAFKRQGITTRHVGTNQWS